jgi:hypothetical protein
MSMPPAPLAGEDPSGFEGMIAGESQQVGSLWSRSFEVEAGGAPSSCWVAQAPVALGTSSAARPRSRFIQCTDERRLFWQALQRLCFKC